MIHNCFRRRQYTSPQQESRPIYGEIAGLFVHPVLMAARGDMSWLHLLGILLIQAFVHGISTPKMCELFTLRMEEQLPQEQYLVPYPIIPHLGEMLCLAYCYQKLNNGGINHADLLWSLLPALKK
jgi:hypothetical protein